MKTLKEQEKHFNSISNFKLSKKIPKDKKLEKLQRVNDKIIYVCDVYCLIQEIKTRSQNKKKYLIKEYRDLVLVNQLFVPNGDEISKEFFFKQMKRKCDLGKDEEMKIEKIILKQELSCSFA